MSSATRGCRPCRKPDSRAATWKGVASVKSSDASARLPECETRDCCRALGTAKASNLSLLGSTVQYLHTPAHSLPVPISWYVCNKYICTRMGTVNVCCVYLQNMHSKTQHEVNTSTSQGANISLHQGAMQKRFFTQAPGHVIGTTQHSTQNTHVVHITFFWHTEASHRIDSATQLAYICYKPSRQGQRSCKNVSVYSSRAHGGF